MTWYLGPRNRPFGRPIECREPHCGGVFMSAKVHRETGRHKAAVAERRKHRLETSLERARREGLL